jgi:hypothetical protein
MFELKFPEEYFSVPLYKPTEDLVQLNRNTLYKTVELARIGPHMRYQNNKF